MKNIFNSINYKIKKRKDRNQWKSINETYANLMVWSWKEISENAPSYFKRLDFSVQNTSGVVLEIGAGIGNMTKWLSASQDVTKIYAVDGFQEAIDFLRKYDFPKVIPVLSSVDSMQFSKNISFDFVVMCELLEHLYEDEEMKMLNNIRRNLKENSKFIISTPIGWLDDPHHVRGFSKAGLMKHVEKYYGNITKIDYTSGYSQVVIGNFKI